MASGRAPDGYRLAAVNFESPDGSPVPVSDRYCRNHAFSVWATAPDGSDAGYADFYYDGYDGDEPRPEPLLMCSDVLVFPEHRRRGLATAMYCAAERISGNTVHPYTAQYDDGRAFWLQAERPFGRGVADPADPTLPAGS